MRVLLLLFRVYPLPSLLFLLFLLLLPASTGAACWQQQAYWSVKLFPLLLLLLLVHAVLSELLTGVPSVAKMPRCGY